MALAAGQKLRIDNLYRGGGQWANQAGTAISATTDTQGSFPTTIQSAPTFVTPSGGTNNSFTLLLDGLYTIDTSVRCAGGGNLQCSIYSGSGGFTISGVLRAACSPTVVSVATTRHFTANTIIKVNWWFPTGASLDTGFGEATGISISYHGVTTP